jgi:hypothetical protein
MWNAPLGASCNSPGFLPRVSAYFGDLHPVRGATTARHTMYGPQYCTPKRGAALFRHLFPGKNPGAIPFCP